jgi:uncharacterized membrane protein
MNLSTITQLFSSENDEINVTDMERLMSALAGGFLLYSSLSGKYKSVKGSLGSFLLYRALTGHCPVYNAMGKHSVHPNAQNVNIRENIYVERPLEDVYNYWRKLEQLPRFMKHLERVTETDDIHSTWVAKIPGLPTSLTWDAEIVKEIPGRLLSWKSLPGAPIENAGKIVFSNSGQGVTHIKATITYHAPLGKAGEVVARLLNPLFGKMIRDDLRNFETIMETVHYSH